MGTMVPASRDQKQQPLIARYRVAKQVMMISSTIRSRAFVRAKVTSAIVYQSCRSLQITRSQSSSSSPTYYDSQSGMHVPIHNVQEISIILDKSQEDTNLATSFVPAHLYKEDPSSDMPEQLANLHAMGVQGVILPPISFPRDVRNLQTLRNIAPSTEFMFFASAKDVQSASPALKDPNLSLVVNFDVEDGSSNEELNLDDIRSTTTIALLHVGQEDQNPISIANQVATWIDATKGGDFIWVPCGEGSDSDSLERLCEELSYLDLVGKTVASRLIIGGGGSNAAGSTVSKELVEETMFSGVNKFVVCKEDDISLISEIAEAQGKSILLG